MRKVKRPKFAKALRRQRRENLDSQPANVAVASAAAPVHVSTFKENYLAVFRAYEWSPEIELLAERFFSATAFGRQIVLADETRGPLPIPSRYEKLSHTSDLSALGLINYPEGRSLWYNVDYGPLVVYAAMPNYAHYLFSESDLAVNLSLESMMKTVRDEGIDFIAHNVRRAHPGWDWYSNARQYHDEPYESLLFFMVFSNRAMAELLRGRQALSEAFNPEHAERWPFCESFVPTCLAHAGMKFETVNRFANTSYLRFRPTISLSDPISSLAGTLVHSVVSPEVYLRRLFSEMFTPAAYFDESSGIHDHLHHIESSSVRAGLRHAFITSRDHVSLARLEGVRRTPAPVDISGLPEGVGDVSLLKPAISSSTCMFSRNQDPCRDASGANSERLDNDFAFHTDKQSDPWWAVDLLSPCVVLAMTIVNRANHGERFDTFRVESSDDGVAWVSRLEHNDGSEISSDLQQPWITHFENPFVARWVRIVLVGNDKVMHLRQVRVIGSVVE